ADVVRIDRDAGRRGVGRVDSPAAEQRTRHVVLVNLVRAAIVDDPERCAVGHDAFAVRVGTVEAEAAGGVLAAGKTTRGAGVLEHLVLLVIDDPDVGAVGGDAFELGGWVHATDGPGAEQAAARVVLVDVSVRIDHPHGRPSRIARHAARCGVGGRERRGRAATARYTVTERLVGGSVIDDVELGR